MCLDGREPNELSQHLIFHRDSELHYLNATPKPVLRGAGMGLHFPNQKVHQDCSPRRLPTLAPGSSTLHPAWGAPEAAAQPSLTGSGHRPQKGQFSVCLTKAGFLATCGREFLDTLQAGRGGEEEHAHTGVPRADEGHETTPRGWLTFPKPGDALHQTSQAVETSRCGALCRQDVTLNCKFFESFKTLYQVKRTLTLFLPTGK